MTQNNFRISITGDLGSGKSTVAGLLAKKYGVEHVTLGIIQRNKAAEFGMTTCEFNKFIEGKPEYDKVFDDYQKAYESKEGGLILDSRLGFFFVPSTFSFYLSVDPVEAAKRIVEEGRNNEQYGSVEEAIRKIAERRNSERLRFKDFYGVDILDMNNYDCVIDTTNLSVDEVMQKMIEAYKGGKKTR